MFELRDLENGSTRLKINLKPPPIVAQKTQLLLKKYGGKATKLSSKFQYYEIFTTLETINRDGVLRRKGNSMTRLSTIQKRNNLNAVQCTGEVGPGGAHHAYDVLLQRDGETIGCQTITFQKGPRSSPDAVSGILDTDLLEIVRHRLQCFQAGEFACRENALALTHVEEALLWMNKRVEDRAERGVLGTSNK